MAKQKFRTKKNTIKIAEFLADTKLSDSKFQHIIREVGIRMSEGQKNIDIQEAARIRAYLNEERRRAELRGKVIDLPSIIKVTELAKRLELPVGEVLSMLLKNGVLANLNDDLDYETAAIISEELGYKTNENVEELEKDVLTPDRLIEILSKEDTDKQETRPPVITILGHVDHGKTTLLDSIRSANIASGEAGGITQAISSYQVEHNNRHITFIDTPGHETFDFMRQRGAKLADIAILVVAADDGVKPQTKDAIEYIKNEGIPVIVAINKIDKEGANIDRVKKELADLELAAEDWGGDTTMVEVSALKKQGIDALLEMILLTADLNPPQAVTERNGLGTVIESNLDKNLGPLAAVLVHTGTIAVGDHVVIGSALGRVRRLLDFNGKDIKRATPSMPATIVGLKDVPAAGAILQVVEEQEEAITKAAAGRAPIKHVSKSNDDDERQTLALVLKADSQGSLEAIEQTIAAMVPEDVRLSIIRAEVGDVSDSDVLTARAGEALIYGFNTRVAGMSKKLADKEGVSIRLYDVIYRLAEDVREEIENRLPVDVVREDAGRLKVLKVFFSTQKKQIVGGEVAEGTIEKDMKITIWRNTEGGKEEVGHGDITGIQREKQEIQRAEQGDQIGLTIEGRGKIKEGDVLHIFSEKTVRKELGESQDRKDK